MSMASAIDPLNDKWLLAKWKFKMVEHSPALVDAALLAAAILMTTGAALLVLLPYTAKRAENDGGEDGDFLFFKKYGDIKSIHIKRGGYRNRAQRLGAASSSATTTVILLEVGATVVASHNHTVFEIEDALGDRFVVDAQRRTITVVSKSNSTTVMETTVAVVDAGVVGETAVTVTVVESGKNNRTREYNLTKLENMSSDTMYNATTRTIRIRPDLGENSPTVTMNAQNCTLASEFAKIIVFENVKTEASLLMRGLNLETITVNGGPHSTVYECRNCGLVRVVSGSRGGGGGKRAAKKARETLHFDVHTLTVAFANAYGRVYYRHKELLSMNGTVDGDLSVLLLDGERYGKISNAKSSIVVQYDVSKVIVENSAERCTAWTERGGNARLTSRRGELTVQARRRLTIRQIRASAINADLACGTFQVSNVGNVNASGWHSNARWFWDGSAAYVEKVDARITQLLTRAGSVVQSPPSLSSQREAPRHIDIIGRVGRVRLLEASGDGGCAIEVHSAPPAPACRVWLSGKGDWRYAGAHGAVIHKNASVLEMRSAAGAVRVDEAPAASSSAITVEAASGAKIAIKFLIRKKSRKIKY